ncbi:GNAT family N-acetyltransferase [Thermoflavimicrobium daqui]|jgi:RimJ/RimL family protein N-acetyltransferase|uniref:GNAT family N-acetyltransferase n=1 Tax=Thermoflavimicrobium daqui TaxID=2137476 RepID=A0A364K3Y7_9BACL|nr:GNAT family protein [Thermoflavimicrobium daqui]RAL24083.1 GNAT family N-acetyltransferase [Thermoflavimicrobium daqui]
MTLKYTQLFRGDLVRLTSFQIDDAHEMVHWYEDADFLRKLDTDLAFPRTLQELQEKDQLQCRSPHGIQFGIRTLESNELIGFVALHGIEWNNQTGMLAIGIGDPQYRHKGYGTDALRLILRYAFHELNLNRVGLDVIQYNESAIRAYEKVGFIIEGRIRSAVLRDGNSYDRIFMGILRDEWEGTTA